MSQPDLVGSTIGNYQIEELLGVGGMGHVYRARHLHLEWLAAVKVLHAHMAADTLFRARFLQEARAVAMLEHANIVRLFDFGQQDGQLYLVMELLTDDSLRSLLQNRSESDSVWSMPLGINLVRQAADGLTYAHERTMIHRDIKPDNLLLQHTPNDQTPFIVKLADFGLARLGDSARMTATGVTIGTPAYMSPEQCQNNLVDARSDIYSLGIVLYEVVTGQLPFRMRSLSDAIYSHVYVAPPPPRLLQPNISDELEAVILRCLAKHPDNRFQSTSELAKRLDEALSVLSADRPVSTGISAVSDSRVALDPPVSTAIDAGTQVPRIYALNPAGEVIEMADLTGDGLTVGRLPDNRLVLAADGVSRHHLLIDWDGGRARVTDIGSTHGTVLAGTLIPAHVPRDWDPDDVVQIAGLQLRLVVPAVLVPEQPRHDADAVADAARPIPVAARLNRWRWPILGAAIVLLAIGAFLVFATGNDAEEPGLAAAQNRQPTPATGVEWIAETVADPAVGPLLGQPLADPVAIRTPFQEFERGVIVSLVDVIDGGGLLVTIATDANSDAGSYTQYDVVERDAGLLETPESGPSAELYPPSEPFAAIWHTVPGLRDEIGWATDEEPGDGVVYQRFERGLVVFLAETSRTWVFYGELLSGSSNAWRAFWNEILEPDESAVIGLQQIERVAEIETMSGQLGAPVTDAVAVEIPYQPFEHGLMFTSDFLALENLEAAGYVITLVAEGGDEAGTWRSDHLVTVMLDPNVIPLGTPPAELYAPGYPFDIIVQRRPELVRALGWSPESSLGSQAAWQRFEHGFIIWFADTSRCWVILGDAIDTEGGHWRSYWDE